MMLCFIEYTHTGSDMQAVMHEARMSESMAVISRHEAFLFKGYLVSTL